jgi:hypothetical protein
MSKAKFSLFDVVAPGNMLENYSADREFIITKKDSANLTVKDFFSGKTITARVDAFRPVRAGTPDEIFFAKTPY